MLQMLHFYRIIIHQTRIVLYTIFFFVSQCVFAVEECGAINTQRQEHFLQIASKKILQAELWDGTSSEELFFTAHSAGVIGGVLSKLSAFSEKMTWQKELHVFGEDHHICINQKRAGVACANLSFDLHNLSHTVSYYALSNGEPVLWSRLSIFPQMDEEGHLLFFENAHKEKVLRLYKKNGALCLKGSAWRYSQKVVDNVENQTYAFVFKIQKSKSWLSVFQENAKK